MSNKKVLNLLTLHQNGFCFVFNVHLLQADDLIWKNEMNWMRAVKWLLWLFWCALKNEHTFNLNYPIFFLCSVFFFCFQRVRSRKSSCFEYPLVSLLFAPKVPHTHVQTEQFVKLINGLLFHNVALQFVYTTCHLRLFDAQIAKV